MDAHDLIPVKKNPDIEEFASGDTVRVNVKVVEGERVRTQAYEGVVIRRRGKAQGETFTVRRVANTVFRVYGMLLFYYGPSQSEVV